MKFGITLVVKDLGQKGKSKFEFKLTTGISEKKVNLQLDDTLLNYTLEKTMLMNGKDPWHGAREKHPRFFGWLVERTIVEGDTVMDYTTGIGNF